MAKSPIFTSVSVLTLAFGIGLSTTLFSVFNAVALKPIPVRDAARVMRLERWFDSNRHGNVQYAFSYMEYRYVREHATVFDSVIAASFPHQVTTQLPSTEAGAGASAQARGQLVSANYFSDLGVAPVLGRGFDAAHEIAGADPVVVLSYAFWHTQLNDDARIVGRVLTINAEAYTVIGVTPREFVGTGNPPVVPDLWIPLVMQERLLPGSDWLHTPLDYEVQMLGHLRPAVTMKQAEAETALLMRQFASAYPNPEQRTTTVTLQAATFFGNTEDPRFKAVVALLMAIAGMVLAIACANLANLLLAKAADRQRELAVRRALGASRGRLIAQLLTESTMLSLGGGAIGLFLSLWGTRVLWVAVGQFAGAHSAFITTIGPDARVFAYTLLLSFATGVVFGLSPALEGSRQNLGYRFHRSRLRGLLIGTQVAVSMVFLISTGLLARGLIRSQSVVTGFETRRIYPLGMVRVSDPAKNVAVRRREIELLQSAPEVQDLAVVDYLPLSSTWTTEVEPLGAAPAAPQGTLANHVSSTYFHAMGIPIVRGRTFAGDEASRDARVAIVSDAMARKSWPGQDPLGKRLKLEVARSVWNEFEVVGVVGDVRTASLSRVDPAFVYLPTNDASLGDYALLLRIEGDSERGFAAIARTLAILDGQQRTGFRLQSLDDGAVQAQILMGRTFALSAALLALTALALASIGIYGVTAFVVSQREKEIGIRMALGAAAGDVLRLLIAQAMRPVIVGGFVGGLVALGVSGMLHALLVFPGTVDMLYGGRWFDPVAFIGLSALVAALATAACYLPARRVTNVDPMAALRDH
jgi:predicted permease